jgi:D-alanyl-D-alanine carboxypeptidase
LDFTKTQDPTNMDAVPLTTHILPLVYVVILLLTGAPLNTLVSGEDSLPPWYSPEENPQARQALDSMTEALGLPIEVSSDYRSFREQQEAYLRLISEEGQERAEQVIALPGHSEHQMGTAYDVTWAGLPIEFDVPRNRQLWSALEMRAHEFGFVISYPFKEIDEWPYHNRWYPVITEFRWEPWHIRYVGVELATRIYEEGYLDPRSPVLPQDFYEPWP